MTDSGDVYSLALKAINIETATVAVSYLSDLAKTTRIETWLATRDGAGFSGTGAAAARPAAAAQVPQSVPVTLSEPAITYNIGDQGPAGGFVFYDKGVVSNGWRYMEVAPNDIGPAQWGTYGTVINGTSTAVGTGRTNTQRIVSMLDQNREDGAAMLCTSLNINGFTDWFLPSKDELNLMYVNLKANGLGRFSNRWYWSSSQSNSYSNNDAWVQNFSDGSQADAGWNNVPSPKNSANPIRAIRQF